MARVTREDLIAAYVGKYISMEFFNHICKMCKNNYSLIGESIEEVIEEQGRKQQEKVKKPTVREEKLSPNGSLVFITT